MLSEEELITIVDDMIEDMRLMASMTYDYVESKIYAHEIELLERFKDAVTKRTSSPS